MSLFEILGTVVVLAIFGYVLYRLADKFTDGAVSRWWKNR